METRKGGRKKPNTPNREKMETESIEPRLVRVEYIDPVLVKNANPRLFKPSIREAVGWEIPVDDYIILLSDKPKSYQMFEVDHPEIAFLIPNRNILSIWDLTQSFRSTKNN